MSTGVTFGTGQPYVGTNATDTDDTGAGSPVIEKTLTASQASFNIRSVIARPTI